MKQGYRIWEIDDKTRVPKEIATSDIIGDMVENLSDLDLENKTYAIRIGKKGLE